jgi:uncharacterized protein (AIM24 family)
VICQKDAFLCAAKGVSVGIEFQQKLGTGLFGGEGFIMEKLEGDGMAFLHAGGHVLERKLQPGETLKIDTGCIVGFTSTVDYDIMFVGGIKNTLFSAVKDYSLLRCAGRALYGSKPCRSAVWRAVFFNMQLLRAARKEAC